jgi:hypothetical protein
MPKHQHPSEEDLPCLWSFALERSFCILSSWPSIIAPRPGLPKCVGLISPVKDDARFPSVRWRGPDCGMCGGKSFGGSRSREFGPPHIKHRGSKGLGTCYSRGRRTTGDSCGRGRSSEDRPYGIFPDSSSPDLLLALSPAPKLRVGRQCHRACAVFQHRCHLNGSQNTSMHLRAPLRAPQK